MSKSNYRPSDGPLGKFRESGPIPETLPIIDTDAFLSVTDWREKRYKRPFLDDLLGHYMFHPSKKGVETYTQGGGVKPHYPVERAAGREAVRQLIEAKKQAEQDAVDAEQRQKLHIAESAEKAITLFTAVAVMRQYYLIDVLEKMKRGEALDPESAVYAADAIEDFGKCIDDPYDLDFHKSSTSFRKTSAGIKRRVDSLSPDVGKQVAAFGLYATEHPKALESYEGALLLEATLDEQHYRIGQWQTRRNFLYEVYPDLTPSTQLLNLEVPLGEMLNMQEELRAQL